VRVSEEAVLAAMAEEERVARKPPEVAPELPGSYSEAPGGRPEVPGSDEPIEAAYRVASEASAAVALVPLATMVEELRGLAAELQEMSRRNEALALEVGQLRERQVGHTGQLAAKDETIATQATLIAELRQRAEAAEIVAAAPDPRVEMLERQTSSDKVALALLHRRVEAAEVEAARRREEAEQAQAERDRLIAAQAAPKPPHEAGGARAKGDAADSSGGFVARVRRFFGGE
jgi:chromosome segregation ATPase